MSIRELLFASTTPKGLFDGRQCEGQLADVRRLHVFENDKFRQLQVDEGDIVAGEIPKRVRLALPDHVRSPSYDHLLSQTASLSGPGSKIAISM